VSILEESGVVWGGRESVACGRGADHEDSSFTPDPQPLAAVRASQARWSADRVLLANPEANRKRIAEAEALGAPSDVAWWWWGDNEHTAREAYADNHLGDRRSCAGGAARELVRKGSRCRKPDGAVLINGRPAAIPELAERAPAILEDVSGQEGEPRSPMCYSAT